VLGVGLFAWIFPWITNPRSRPAHIAVAALVVQIVLGVLVTSDFLVLTALELSFIFQIRIATIWLATQEMIFLGISFPLITQLSSDTTMVSATETVHYSWFGLLATRSLGILTAAP
jgi:hypothetical protein